MKSLNYFTVVRSIFYFLTFVFGAKLIIISPTIADVAAASIFVLLSAYLTLLQFKIEEIKAKTLTSETLEETKKAEQRLNAEIQSLREHLSSIKLSSQMSSIQKRI